MTFRGKELKHKNPDDVRLVQYRNILKTHGSFDKAFNEYFIEGVDESYEVLCKHWAELCALWEVEPIAFDDLKGGEVTQLRDFFVDCLSLAAQANDCKMTFESSEKAESPNSPEATT